MTAVERKSEFKLTTDPYLALTGEFGVSIVRIWVELTAL